MIDSSNRQLQSAPWVTPSAQFNADDPADRLTVFAVEPGDTPGTIDIAMNGGFLTNHYSRRRLSDPGFVPCFETLEEYATVYEMLFIQSDERHALVILVPKTSGIDAELLAVCAQYATPAQEVQS